MSIITELNRIRRENMVRVVEDQIREFIVAETDVRRFATELAQYFVATGLGDFSIGQVINSLRGGRLYLLGIRVRCHKIESKTDSVVIRRDGNSFDAIAPSILALQAVVDANKRYVELTGRPQDAVALHPDHARELLDLLLSNISVDMQTA